MKKLFSMAALAAVVACSQLQADTILVNFVSDAAGSADADRTINTATAADYQGEDAAVNGSATVAELAFNRNNPFTSLPANFSLDSGVGLTADLSVTGPASLFGFTARDSALYGTTPILDTYIAFGTLATPIEFTVSGLDELQTGSDFILTIYAAGDAADQAATTTVTYNGLSPVENTTATNGGDPAAQFTFTKAAGVNEISVSSVGNDSRFHAINGFSITGTTVPEPTTFALLAFAGTACAAGAVRRRR